MADDDALSAYLRTIPLLRGVPPEDVTRLARKAPPPRSFRPAAREAEPTVIYREGDASTALYVVLGDGAAREPASGEGRPVVQVSVEDDKLTTRVRLWRVYPGDYFGDFEFIGGSETGRFPLRLTKAVPLSACRVLEIPFKLLNDFIDEHPVLFRRLARDAVGRFQQTLEDALAGKVSDPDIALASWMVERARDFGIREGNHVRFRSAISQESIGRDLGVTRETISLRLNEWRRRGLMASGRGQQLVIRDMERVERIAALALERSRNEHRAAVDSVDAALAHGDNFRARNFALDVLSYFPGSVELKHRAALAVARCGATQEALGLLERFGFGRDATPEQLDRVVRAGIADPASPPKARTDDFDLEEINEQIAAAGDKDRVATLTEDILSLSPRLWKDLAFRPNGLDRKAAKEAYEGYRRAFAASGRTYSGVNAASLAVTLGLPKEADALVGDVLKKFPRRAATYWDCATKGEALLLRGDTAAAAECFATALACPDAFEGSIAATRLQLSRLAHSGVHGARDMLAALPNRPVAVFSGPAMSGKDMDAGAQDAATETLAVALREYIRARRIGHVHGGLRAGAEIIAAEAAMAEGAALHVVLPTPVDDYMAAAVLPGEPARSATATRTSAGARTWRERFDHCLSHAASLTLMAQKTPPARESDAAFVQAFRYAAGQTLARADALLAPCLSIAIGDGEPATMLHASQWTTSGHEVVRFPCGWDAPAAVPRAASPWRPIVLAWLLGADSAEGHLSARGVSETAIRDAEVGFAAAAGPDMFVLRRTLGGNRPQSALVAVAPDLEAALDLAERLRRIAWPQRIAAQVALDFGPVLGANGLPNEERLKDLDTGNGPLEAPDRLLLASASFTMEARLALGTTVSAVALGRVARLESAASAVQLLPSTEIYAVSRGA